MKRTIAFLSFVLVFAVVAFAQTSRTQMSAKCPMNNQADGSADCKACCHGSCEKDCCKNGCDMKCCSGDSAKMCNVPTAAVWVNAATTVHRKVLLNLETGPDRRTIRSS